MKKSILLLSAGLFIASGAMAETTKFNCVADTWIRENNLGYKGGSADKLEIRKDAVKNEADEITGYVDFAGLYGFNFNIPAGQKVQKATVRIVTERWKGCPINVYAYGNNFDEGSACWETEGNYVSNALKGEAIIQFTPKAQRNKSLGSDEIGEEYRNISEWTNVIDITNYAKSIPSGRINLLLVAAEDNVNQNCFFTKEVSDIVNGKDATLTFSASDLMPILEVEFAEDADVNSDVILPVADTQIRWNNTTNYGGNPHMEIYTRLADGYDLEDENPEFSQEFYGLLRFNLPAEILDADKYEFTGAKLRLVCTQWKRDRNMQLFDYENNFAENTTFATEETYVRSALAGEPVAEFAANGASNWAMGDGNRFGEEYYTAEAWTSYIDLTEYVADKAADGVSTINLLLKRRDNNPSGSGDAMKFATKEAVDIECINKDDDNKVVAIFKAADLVPQLTITYTKKDNTEGPEDPNEDEPGAGVEAVEINAPVEYFNLQGVRVANPDKGIYIVRQGNKVSKVVVK